MVLFLAFYSMLEKVIHEISNSHIISIGWIYSEVFLDKNESRYNVYAHISFYLTVMLVYSPDRVLLCLSPWQRDLHTMSRGTTLFSCGTVGELSPLSAFMPRCLPFLLSFPFHAIKLHPLEIYAGGLAPFLFFNTTSSPPHWRNGLTLQSPDKSKPQGQRPLTITVSLFAPPPSLSLSHFCLSLSVTHPPLMIRAHLPPHNVAHRSHGSQL